MDLAEVHQAIETRKAPVGVSAPTGVLTPFGWCIVGRVSANNKVLPGASFHCNFIRSAEETDPLHSLVENFWKIESLGIKEVKTPESKDDNRALEVFRKAIRHNGERYEVGLPWKSTGIRLPDNRNAALRRLFSVERRFKRDTTFAQNYEAIKTRIPERDCPTKREILRTVASIFDPLGFLSPVILKAKSLLQEIWRRKPDWDEPLSEDLLNAWTSWVDGLSVLETLKIPRCLRPNHSSFSTQLHVFCDASELGYGAVAYLHVEHDRLRVSVSFLMSKSRVTPLSQKTIPRLELEGALVASRLARTIKSELRIPIQNVQFWTDSTTVLRWLNSSTCRFTTFVANRVGEILETSVAFQWAHIPAKLNPADFCSRGLTGSGLMEQPTWLTGPEFLREATNSWPPPWKSDETETEDPEVLPSRWSGHVSSTEPPAGSLLNSVSRLSRAKRVVAYLLRFAHNCKLPRTDRITGPLTTSELKLALICCLKASQKDFFGSEITALRAGEPIPNPLTLLKLDPFLDPDGLIRVGGRIQHAEIDYNAKHPIVLHPNDHLTRLVIWDAHERVLHASTERTLADLRQAYWVTSGRRAVSRIVRQCVQCRRTRSIPQPPIMAPLPKERLKGFQSPFTNTGIDFFGPLTVVMHRRVHKRYGCLFTCLVTRAVHLEITHSLDTDSFLMALRRFISRRGSPSVCFSDNGTNLAAGERELREGLKRLDQQKIYDNLAQRGIEWHFSPPSAPHFGGVWERLVRSAKVALRATLRNRTATDEVLLTVMAEVESLINGRPLTHVSVDARDPEPLTPNHFLLGRANPNIPPDVIHEEDINSRKRWRATQAIVNSFWRRWMREYVPALTKRKTWLRHQRNLQEGDLVLLVDNNTPRGLWPLGRIVAPLPGPDGIVRAAVVQTAAGTYTRPTVKMCLLEEGHGDDQDPEWRDHSKGKCFTSGSRAGDVPDEPGRTLSGNEL